MTALIASPVYAKTVRVQFSEPYDLQSKVEMTPPVVSATKEIPYDPGVFCGQDGLCDSDLKKASDSISSEAKALIWKKYLATVKAKHVLQKTKELDLRINDLVVDVELSHRPHRGDKVIIFTVTGRINTNLVSQIAGYAPSAKEMDKAKKRALGAALENYISKLDSSKTRKVREMRGELRSRVSELVSISSIDAEPQPESSSIQYFVRANVNDRLFDEILFSNVEINETGEGSLFGFIVLPRIQESVESFGATVNERAVSKSGSVTQKERDDVISDNGEALSESVSERSKSKSVASKQTSSSVVRKSNQAQWRIANATPSDSQINKHFTNNGYELIDFNDIMDNCGTDDLSADGVREDLLASKSGTLSRGVNRALTQVVKACDVPLFGVGVIDIDSIMTDRNSGGITASVVVNIQVKDYSRRLPKKVASVGPQRFKGIGASQEAAIDAALIEAASKASDLILSQLKTKRIR